MKFVAAFLLFIMPCKLLKAQSIQLAIYENTYKAALRFNVTGLIDPLDNNLSVGGEYTLHPRWSVIADIAWITYSTYFRERKGFTGYIFRPAIRHYTSARHTAFLEASFFYKHINYRMEDWLGKDCINDVPAYEQYQRFTYGKRVAGASFLAGLQTNLTKDERLRFEAYIGAAVRYRYQHVIGIENACYNTNAGAFNPSGSTGSTVLPGLPMGMRVVYCIQ